MRKSKLRLGSLVTILGFTLTAFLFGTVAQAQTTTLYLNPADYVFPESTPLGTKFNVSVYVSDAVNVAAAQITLEYNDTLINVTRYFEPTTNTSYLFYGKHSTAWPPPPEVIYERHGSTVMRATGNVFIDLVNYPNETPVNGSGLVVIFEFNITKRPPPLLSSVLKLDVKNLLNDTYLLDINSTEIQGVVKMDGSYTLIPEFMPIAALSTFMAITTTIVLLKRKRIVQKHS